MNIKRLLPIGRLVGKIDNDYNIDNSDWIPRIAAYTIDCLNILNCLPREFKFKELNVDNKIAISSCELDTNGIKIYDKNNCEISPLKGSASSCSCNSSNYNNNGRNYIISGGNKIELNFNTDKIIIKSLEVATYFDDYYNCDVPYIYDNGLLLEALAAYCLYRMLGRGYKHPVFDLKSNNEAINPYLQWIKLKDNAKASVISDLRKSSKDEGWNNFFYNSTFLPRTY